MRIGKQKSASAGEDEQTMDKNNGNGNMMLSPLLPAEISNMIEKLGIFAHLDMSYSEFKDIVQYQKVFKVMLNNSPFGVIAITKDSLAKVKIWLSEKESQESWNEAIGLAATQAFKEPSVYKIDWLISKHNKDLIECAINCGFNSAGDRLNEGPNRETVLLFSMPRNGNHPIPEQRDNAQSEKIKSDNENLKKAKEDLQNRLRSAEESNKSLQTSLQQEKTDHVHTKSELLLLKEKFAKSGDPSKIQKENDELKATIKRLEEKATEQNMLLDGKSQQIIKQIEMLKEKDVIITEMQKKEIIQPAPLDTSKQNSDDNADKDLVIKMEPKNIALKASERILFHLMFNNSELTKKQLRKILQLAQSVIQNNIVALVDDGIVTDEKIDHKKDHAVKLKRPPEEVLNMFPNLAKAIEIAKTQETTTLATQASTTEIKTEPESAIIKDETPQSAGTQANSTDKEAPGKTISVKDDQETIINKPETAITETKSSQSKTETNPITTSEVARNFLKKVTHEPQQITDYDRMMELLTEYRDGDIEEKGINGNQICLDACNKKGLKLSVAKSILHNISKQNKLKYIAKADNVFNSVVILKQ